MSFKNYKENISLNKININGILFYVDLKNETIHQCEYVQFNAYYRDEIGSLKYKTQYLFNIGNIKYNTMKKHYPIFFVYEEALDFLKKAISDSATYLNQEIENLNSQLDKINKNKDQIAAKLKEREEKLENMNKKIILF